jgi:adenine phosphoribosyltransferase
VTTGEDPQASAPRAVDDDIGPRLVSSFPLVHDHPDVAGVLRDPELLRLLGPALASPFRGAGVTKVCAPEARGPILGALVALELGAGLVLIRKDERNHPGADVTLTSEPTWRGGPERFRARSFDVGTTDVALVVDDWITTGSSIRAARGFVLDRGATYAGAAVLVNKAAPATLAELAVHWLVRFDDLVGR